MSRLARVLTRQGRNGEAEALQREALRIERRALGPEHEGTLHAIDGLVGILWMQRDASRYAEAEALQRVTLSGPIRTSVHVRVASQAVGRMRRSYL